MNPITQDWEAGPPADGAGPVDQAAVWIHPDSLPRADEECRSGGHADGLGQFVPAAQAIAAYMRGESVHHTPAADDEAETGGILRRNTVKK
ncbi:MAG: hypothetical protein K2Y09_11415 [Nitrosomonas sp.]|nr:hypothetical protein [Nitrosomonas sp.]